MHITVPASSFTRHKRQCRYAVGKRELVFGDSRHLRRFVFSDHPHRIPMFLVASLLESNHRCFLSARVGLRNAKTPTLLFFVHEVGNIQLWRAAKAVSCEVNMFGSTHKYASALGGYAYQFSRCFFCKNS